jgi:nitrogen fixation/metabolism regulation signal transduction histidine kinase
MVAAIVKRHGGELALSDARDHADHPGLRCLLSFPLASSENH